MPKHTLSQLNSTQLNSVHSIYIYSTLYSTPLFSLLVPYAREEARFRIPGAARATPPGKRTGAVEG
nr:MAG TPA: hypothetical protein [Caudoviricetes sp.]